MNIEAIAKIAYDSYRAYCQSVGESDVPLWGKLPKEKQQRVIAAAAYYLVNIDASASQHHDSWMQAKIDDGWTLGEVEDAAARTHPLLLPFNELPAEQQAKGLLLRNAVWALAGLLPKYLE